MDSIKKPRGLTLQEVNARIQAGKVNYRNVSGTKSVKEILKSNLLTYFNLVFVILGVLLVLARSYRDLTFIGVIAANALIGIVQELHSKKILDRMSIVSQPRVKVVRDEKEMVIPSDEIVADDLIYLSGGMQIPADCVVLEGELHVNESMLTGESDEIEKVRGKELLSGSIVISGSCSARVKHVGMDSYASRLMQQATKMKTREQSEIFRSLNSMLKFFGIIIIPIGIILFVQQYVYSDASFSDAVTGMVAALIGMIPEGIYLLTSTALAVSAVRLSSQKVLVHDLKCIETLARVNILCVDKTGTITEKEMKVETFLPLTDHLSQEQTAGIIADFAGNMPEANDTLQAMRAAFDIPDGRKLSAYTGFSSKYKYSAATLDAEHFVLGAPEYVLGAQLSKYQNEIADFAAEGCRVVALARYPYLPKGEVLSGECDPIALVVLRNPIRKGAKKTFEYFRRQGVQIRVISGDNPETVSSIAAQAGIPNASMCIDVSQIRSDEALIKAAGKYTVFGRVNPEQKKLLVKAMRDAGNTVAMTGDGVNDIIAMKEADCSVAMASGSEAASQAAQLVLLDSDFAHMPSIVAEGRRVVNNIQRAASLYLVKNIFSLCLAVFSMILMLNYPLEPSQVSLISMFTIGIPSFILALEPNTSRIRGHFLSNVVSKALPAGLTDFLTVSGLVLFCREFEVEPTCVSTACSIVVAIVGFMIVYHIMEKATVKHLAMLLGIIAGWIVCLIYFSSFFGIESLTQQTAMLTFVFCLLTEPVLRYASLLGRKCKEDIRVLRQGGVSALMVFLGRRFHRFIEKE
ncbi:MAG: HAD-IC family P-type ATPase [Lachnospiraceae bacterium]|nr:HAD-IC family P-type ATPase [Lachnospiraceae bacterium]